MKRVIAGCIDLTLEFDSSDEVTRYIQGITEKHQNYKVLQREDLQGDRVRIRIQRQYNNSPFPEFNK